jgi:mannosyltransferase
VLAGFLGFVISVAFSWVPSVWYDESATIVSATRTWKELWAEIHHVDAVHATY